MVDEVLHLLYRVVVVATMYTINACGLNLLERLLPSGSRVTQVITTQNTDINDHTAKCTAFALRGIPHVICLILQHFLILSKFMQTLFLI